VPVYIRADSTSPPPDEDLCDGSAAIPFELKTVYQFYPNTLSSFIVRKFFSYLQIG
jgi:hypothetical protein